MPGNDITGYSRGYEYREGDSESDFVNRNLAGDLTDWRYLAQMGATGGAAGPFLGVSRGLLGGKKAYKRAHDAWVRKRRAEEMGQRQDAYSGYTRGIDEQASADDRRRMDALAKLEAGFNDPSRAESRYDIYSANLGNELATISTGYRDSSQRAAQEARRRGRLGSSTDAEKQSKLGQVARSSTMGAENAAYDQLAGLEDADYQQMQNLRRSLLTGDPQAQQTYQAMAGQTSGQVDRLLQQGADQQRQREQAAQAEMSRYALYGGLANAGASATYGFYGNPQYGGYQ